MNVTNFLKQDKYHSLFKISDFTETYSYSSFSFMVSQFHTRMAHEGKNIRWLRGENSIHTAFKQNFDYNNDFVDQFPLKQNDAFIISVPFFLYGDMHPLYDWYMTECTRLNIPVALDFSLLGSCDTSEVPTINLSYGCIQEAWVRLKYSNFTHHNLNFRITKFPIAYYNKISKFYEKEDGTINNTIPDNIHINEVIDTYKRSPIILEDGFKPASCIHYAIDTNKHPDHNVDGVGYRKIIT